jgi:hypothetical protein
VTLAACGGETQTDPGFCGHACRPNDPINLPEGGEVRLEIVRDKDGEGFEIRTHAYFVSDQTPDARPWNRDPKFWQTTVEVSDENPMGVCADVSSKTLFPNGLPESRTYADVGETVTLTTDGAEEVLARFEPFDDNVFNNVHDIGYYKDIDPDEVPLDVEWDVELGDGTLVTEDEKLYMPPKYEMDFPNLKETVLINRNEDFPLTWTDDAPDDDPFLYGFTAFGDALGVRIFCIGPNTGVMVVPSEVFPAIPPAGWMQHGLLSHRVVGIDGRRVDLFGVSCDEGAYSLTDASE